LSLKNLPCRNPDNFTRLHTTGAIRRIVRMQKSFTEILYKPSFQAVRPTYTAELDSDAKGITVIKKSND
jgi:hypothetical protein